MRLRARGSETLENSRRGKGMIAADVAWPKKTRELRTLHLDSTIWNDFKFRDDDIIISTYGKSGTTWMQQIISQMLFAGDTEQDTQAMMLSIRRQSSRSQ